MVETGVSVVAVTGGSCTAEQVLGLAAAGAVVIVWSADAHECGRLAGLVRKAGGRAATLVGPPSAGGLLLDLATELFGRLDQVLGAADRADGPVDSAVDAATGAGPMGPVGAGDQAPAVSGWGSAPSTSSRNSTISRPSNS